MARRRPFRLNAPRLAQRLNPLFRRNSDWAEWGAVFREELEEGGLRGTDLEEALGDLKGMYDDGDLVLTQDNIDTLIGMIDDIVGLYSEGDEPIAEVEVIEKEEWEKAAPVPAHLAGYRATLVGLIEDLRAEGLVNIPRKKARRNRSRRNPFNVRDQTPLILYAARVGRPGEDVSVLDDLRAARMLLAHVDELDIDGAELQNVIRQIENQARSQGLAFTPTPSPFVEPGEKDYLITDPRGNTVETSEGRFDYYWQPGTPVFYVKFEGRMFGGPTAFLESIQGQGYRIKEVSRQGGTSIFPEFQLGLNAAPAVLDLLLNYNLDEAAALFGAAAAEWARLVPAVYSLPPGEGRATEWVSEEDLRYLKDYYRHFAKSPYLNRTYPEFERIIGKMSPAVQSTIIEVMRASVLNATEFVLYPHIVEVPSGIPGEIEVRAAAMDPGGTWRSRYDNPSYQSFRFLRGSRELKSTKVGGSSDMAQFNTYYWIPNAPWLVGNHHVQGTGDASHYTDLARYLELGQAGGRSAIGDIKDPMKWEVMSSRLTPKGREDAAANVGDGGKYSKGEGSRWDGQGRGMVLFSPYRLKFTSMDERQLNRLANRFDNAGLWALAAFVRIAWGGLALGAADCKEQSDLAGAVRIADTTFVGARGTRDIPGIVATEDGKPASDEATTALRVLATAYQPPASFKALHKKPESDKIGAKMITEVYRPFPYQEVGIAFAQIAKGRCMIGDEMGLGKTIQALGFLATNPCPTTGKPVLPALVIAPGSVVGNWKNEVQRWLPHLSVEIYEAKGGRAPVPNTDVVVVPWKTNGLYTNKLINRFQTIIVDEAHYGKRYRNTKPAKSKRVSIDQLMGTAPLDKGMKITSEFVGRTLGMVRMCHSAPHAILLSGTPIDNWRFDELWSQLYAIDPQTFPDLDAFKVAYRPTDEDGYSKLVEVLECYMVRRRKQDCADQTGLGELRLGFVDGFVPLEVGPNKRIEYKLIDSDDAMEIYEQQKEGIDQVIKDNIRRDRIEHAVRATLAGRDCFAAIEGANSIKRSVEDTKKHQIAIIGYMRTAIAKAKIPSAMQWIQQKVGIEGKAVVIWIAYTETREAIENILKSIMVRTPEGVRAVKYGMIVGGVSNLKRTQIVDDFQKGEIDVIIGSTAMAEGVTLTRANEALFIEYWYLPGKMTQAEDRIYRVGQKRDCTITYLHLPVQEEEWIKGKLDMKRMQLDQILGSDVYMEQSEEDILVDTIAVETAEIIVDNIEEKLDKLKRLSDKITVADVTAVLKTKKAAFQNIYTLLPPYNQPQVLNETIVLLQSPDAADLIFEKAEGVNKGGTRRKMTEWLEAQGGSADRADLLAHFKTLKLEKAALQQLYPDQPLTSLGVIGLPQEDAKLPFRATKKRSVVQFLQGRGGVDDEKNIKKALGSGIKSVLGQLVVSGILEAEREQVIKCESQPEREKEEHEIHTNPRRGVNPPHIERKRLQLLDRLRRQWGAAERKSTKTNRSRKQGSSLQTKYRALQKALSGSMSLAKADKALVAYNALHEAVKAAGRQGSHVPESYHRLLDRAYSMISRYVG